MHTTICFFPGEDILLIYVLVKFTETDYSTVVIPLQRVLDLWKETDLVNMQAGQNVTVLWCDGKKYPAFFFFQVFVKYCLYDNSVKT